jgi:fatty-acid desaturase
MRALLAALGSAAVEGPVIEWVALAGLAFPFLLALALTGSLAGGLTGLLWGGAVRMFCLHHATFSINSLCHYFGRRAFATPISRATRSGSPAHAGRGVAQQPPRLPRLRAPRAALVGSSAPRPG